MGAACAAPLARSEPPARIRVLLDTDANNELDDQHAIAYMLFSGDVFDVEAITVNRTRGGGDVEKQAEEAERIVKLAGLESVFPVIRGANGSFTEIAPRVNEADFDGKAAVDAIIRHAHASPAGRPLVLLPVGKLTNVALALKKDPSIARKVRIVWLGSNYPEPRALRRASPRRDDWRKSRSSLYETLTSNRTSVVVDLRLV